MKTFFTSSFEEPFHHFHAKLFPFCFFCLLQSKIKVIVLNGMNTHSEISLFPAGEIESFFVLPSSHSICLAN